MTMNRPSKRLMRLVFVVVFAVSALYTDNLANQAERSRLQIVIWTVILFANLVMELRESLRRPKQAYVGLGVGMLHFLVIYLIRNLFPLQTSLLILVWLLPESVVLVFIYGRIGQSMDPTGPFGLTDEERRNRDARH